MCQCIPTAVEMLQSKVVTDVLESLEFLCVAHLFGVDGAVGAISKSLHLVWAQDERLCKAVVSTYVRLYLTCDKPQQVVENLLKITSTANSGELASMEKLVELLVQSGHIPAPAIKELWQIYRLSHPGRGKTEAVLACQLLAVIVPASAPESSWLPNLGHIMSLGFVKLNGESFVNSAQLKINLVLFDRFAACKACLFCCH